MRTITARNFMSFTDIQSIYRGKINLIARGKGEQSGGRDEESGDLFITHISLHVVWIGVGKKRNT